MRSRYRYLCIAAVCHGKYGVEKVRSRKAFLPQKIPQPQAPTTDSPSASSLLLSTLLQHSVVSHHQPRAAPAPKAHTAAEMIVSSNVRDDCGIDLLSGETQPTLNRADLMLIDSRCKCSCRLECLEDLTKKFHESRSGA